MDAIFDSCLLNQQLLGRNWWIIVSCNELFHGKQILPKIQMRELDEIDYYEASFIPRFK